ncbi:hypothetical protein GDI2288 [Gluconacetobacter diazotrophicus PA1 5]|uniref:Uncharacterized protein n=1 Tax=Gluconacetobacter diazotrophicus (strain ATCC 49037 / DSM 5601 / CCUG 37298 / CIP 103539 / LMG 7603 / PAl5) TaxID=272568 RepID=A9HLZ4_GLUDA|nr:hypothetical protein GDI2288 [Gluconacetobacter diazotrophicus PA1 5]
MVVGNGGLGITRQNRLPSLLPAAPVVMASGKSCALNCLSIRIRGRKERFS